MAKIKRLQKMAKQPETNVNQLDEFWGKEQEELIHQLLQAKYGRQFATKTGRPTVLTLPLIERFLQAARQGLPLLICCDYCFIPHQLFAIWKEWYIRIIKRVEPIMQRFYHAQQRGEKYTFSKAEQSSIKVSDEDALVVEFFEKISLIKSEYALRLMVGMNQSAMSGNVNAAQWLLKQAFPDNFAEKDNTSFNDVDGEPTQTGYAYIEINAVQPNVMPNELNEEKNITPTQPQILNGDVTTTDNVQ